MELEEDTLGDHLVSGSGLRDPKCFADSNTSASGCTEDAWKIQTSTVDIKRNLQVHWCFSGCANHYRTRVLTPSAPNVGFEDSCGRTTAQANALFLEARKTQPKHLGIIFIAELGPLWTLRISLDCSISKMFQELLRKRPTKRKESKRHRWILRSLEIVNLRRGLNSERLSVLGHGACQTQDKAARARF